MDAAKRPLERTQLAAIVAHSDAKAQEVQKALAWHRRRPYVLEAIDHQRHLAACEIPWLNALAEKAGGTNYKLERYPRFYRFTLAISANSSRSDSRK